MRSDIDKFPPFEVTKGNHSRHKDASYLFIARTGNRRPRVSHSPDSGFPLTDFLDHDQLPKTAAANQAKQQQWATKSAGGK